MPVAQPWMSAIPIIFVSMPGEMSTGLIDGARPGTLMAATVDQPPD